MGRYDIISPSETFEMRESVRAWSVKYFRYLVEAYHHGICDRSNESITEKKTDGTCVWVWGQGTGGWRTCDAPPFLRAVAVPRNRPCGLQMSLGVPPRKRPVVPVPMTPENGYARLEPTLDAHG